MSNTATEFTTPPARFVFGDLYEPETEDFDGNRMVIKSGADKGKETQQFVIGLAISKTQGHWGSEPGWGQAIWAAGHAAFPGGEAQQPHFSWKIQDGDSQVIPPKSKSKIKPCDREGWKGCWILRLQSAFAPAIYDALKDNGANPVPMDTAGAVLPGYVIQVVGTVRGNTGASPGVYLNHSAVGLRAYLPVISSRGVDVAGKFGGVLPAGASTLPAAGFTPPAAPVPASLTPGYVPLPATPTPVVAAPVPVVVAPTAVVPAPAIVGIPVAPNAPAPLPPGPPPAGAAQMHKGHPIAAYVTRGWTMEQLRADGFAG